MLKIAIYPSNHGFGHATRMSALAQELNFFGIYTFIRTDRPEYLFHNLAPNLHSVSSSATDFGVVHGPQLITDLEATRSKLLKLMSNRLEIIDREVSFLRENEIDLVIADIPFLICEAASYAGIPVFAISNFDWFFIYQDLFKADRELRPVINSIFGLYSRVDQAYQLPFSNARSMGAFVKKQKVGLLARKKSVYQDIRAFHDLDPEKPILLAFHSGVGDIDLGLNQVMKYFTGYVITNNPDSGQNQVITIPQDADMLDYVFSADLILTKPGYSTLAEAVQFGKPLLYRPRENYPEEQPLIEGLAKYPNSCCISDPNKLNAEVRAFLKQVPKPGVKAIHPAYRNRNTEIAQQIYQDFFKIKYSQRKLISVFDAGSNNLNYCVYDLEHHNVVHKTQLPTGLGKKFKNDKLSSGSIRKFVQAFDQIYAYDAAIASEKRIIATGISRKAQNIQLLKDLIKKKYDLKYGVITAKEEAYLVYSVIRNRLRDDQVVVAFDIGGNSTEIIFVRDKQLKKWVSLPLGLLKLEDPGSTPETILNELSGELDSFLVDSVTTLIGIGLTIELVHDLLPLKTKTGGEWGRLTQKDLLHLANSLSVKLSALQENAQATDPYRQFILLSIRMMILFMDKYAIKEILVCKDGISVGLAIAKSCEI